jgi:hypothetical protein
MSTPLFGATWWARIVEKWKYNAAQEGSFGPIEKIVPAFPQKILNSEVHRVIAGTAGVLLVSSDRYFV